jgi:hypothetical protein
MTDGGGFGVRKNSVLCVILGTDPSTTGESVEPRTVIISVTNLWSTTRNPTGG